MLSRFSALARRADEIRRFNPCVLLERAHLFAQGVAVKGGGALARPVGGSHSPCALVLGQRAALAASAPDAVIAGVKADPPCNCHDCMVSIGSRRSVGEDLLLELVTPDLSLIKQVNRR
jgi:hypothetical protein